MKTNSRTMMYHSTTKQLKDKMTNEEVFNREVADLIRINPSWQACTVIQEYMEKHNESSYYDALQRLGASIGIEYHVIEA